jgi:glycosyltransferase involved in cell wall biosynthesis
MSSSSPVFVSIAIPAYNYAHYLPAAIDSLLAQTYPHFEVLVIDDGSKDNTREVVAEYTDPRVRYVWQENAGLSAARNTGVREARHDFVGFLDADDVWEPGLLARVMQQYAELPTEYGAVATAAHRMAQDGRLLSGNHFSFGGSGEIKARDFCLRNRPMSSSIILRKAVFAQCGGFDTTLRSSEDRDMWLRLTTAGWRFWFIDEPLARIRRHPFNMSKNAGRMTANRRRILQKARFSGLVARWSPFWLKVFSIHHYQAAWTYFHEASRVRALMHLWCSWFYWPFFLCPSAVSQPALFRLRALRNFCKWGDPTKDPLVSGIEAPPSPQSGSHRAA